MVRHIQGMDIVRSHLLSPQITQSSLEDFASKHIVERFDYL